MKIQTSKTVQKTRNTIKNSMWQVYVLGAIPLLLIVVFNYIPMIGIILGFKDYRYDKGIFGSEWVGFDNFEVFLKSKDFVTITKNTLIMNAIFIVCGMVAAILVAILLYELLSRKATKVYQTIMITPNFLSWVVVASMVYAFLHPSNGLINSLIVRAGGEKVDWYATPDAWPFILTIASVWKHVGMDSVMYYATLMGIDHSLYEAAELDGASKIQKSLYVTLPHLTSLIIMLTILKIGGIFRADFGLFYQLPRDCGELYSVTDVMDTYIFRTMRVIGDYGLSAAVGLIQSIVGMVLVLVTNHIVNKIDPYSALF